jgi:hypothetical protein
VTELRRERTTVWDALRDIADLDDYEDLRERTRYGCRRRSFGGASAGPARTRGISEGWSIYLAAADPSLSPPVNSVREAAREHLFPEWFRFHRTKWHGFRSVGNAVAPRVARADGREIVKAHEIAPAIPKELEFGSDRLLDMSMSGAADDFGADKSAIPPPRTCAKVR